MEKSKEMQYLFEYHDTLDSPYEAFLYDTSQMAFPIRSHWHYFMELIYMKEGTALIECDGCNYILEPGDLIIFHPEALHGVYAVANGLLKYEVLKFDTNRLYTEKSYAPSLSMILRSASKDEHANVFFRKASSSICQWPLFLNSAGRNWKEEIMVMGSLYMTGSVI